MFSIALAASLGLNPMVVNAPSNSAPSGVVAYGSGTCVGADSVLADNNGYVGCQKLTDVAPQGLLLRPQPAFAGGTQTAANLILAGGQDETKCAIDGADPTVTCAGANDTVTVTVYNSNGTSVATVLTGDVDWTVVASVATTCANLATAIDALAGVGATCTTPNVLITLDTNTAQVTLAESTAACTTISIGTMGGVVLGTGSSTAPYALTFIGDSDSGILYSGANDFQINTGGTKVAWFTAGTSIFTTSILLRGGASNDSGSSPVAITDDLAITGITTAVAATVTLAAAATTWVATRSTQTVACDAGGNTVSTITRPAGSTGSGLYCIRFVDALCTITDTDDGAANTVDLDETDAAAGNIVSADDKTLCLMHDGTSWFQAGKISTN